VSEKQAFTEKVADLLTPAQVQDIHTAFKTWARGGAHHVVLYSDKADNGAAIIRISGFIQAAHPSETLPGVPLSEGMRP
jgi:hypothetical protein